MSIIYTELLSAILIMNRDRLFLDTVFIQAILNQNDQYHQKSLNLLPRVKQAREVWLKEAILMEVGNALTGFRALLIED